MGIPEWHICLLLFVAGGVAGLVNTIAGGGSLLALPALMFAGLPATHANGTNRIQVLIQSLVGARGMHRAFPFPIKRALLAAIPATLGSVVGAWAASRLSMVWMERAIGLALLIGAVVLVVKPKRLLEDREGDAERSRGSVVGEWLMLALAGLYGGFIQASVGVIFLLVLVLGGKLELMKANGSKNMIIAIYTVPSLVIFAAQGHVQVAPGLIMAGGSALGATLAARVALSSRGKQYVTAVVISVVLIASLRLLWR